MRRKPLEVVSRRAVLDMARLERVRREGMDLSPSERILMTGQLSDGAMAMRGWRREPDPASRWMGAVALGAWRMLDDRKTRAHA